MSLEGKVPLITGGVQGVEDELMRNGAALSRVCVVHPESTRTVRTLLAFSHGSGMVQGFETFPNDLAYTAPRGTLILDR